MDVPEPQTLWVLGDVLAHEQMALKAVAHENGRHVRHGQVPVEPAMGKTHHPVVVRIHPACKARAAGTALRGRGECLREPHTAGRERVQVRAPHTGAAV